MNAYSHKYIVVNGMGRPSGFHKVLRTSIAQNQYISKVLQIAFQEHDLSADQYNLYSALHHLAYYPNCRYMDS